MPTSQPSSVCCSLLDTWDVCVGTRQQTLDWIAFDWPGWKAGLGLNCCVCIEYSTFCLISSQLISSSSIHTILSFILIFGGHQSFLWGHWYPLIGLMVTSALSFKARVDSFTCVLCYLYTTNSSDSPLVWHLLTSCLSVSYKHWWGRVWDRVCRWLTVCDKTDPHRRSCAGSAFNSHKTRSHRTKERPVTRWKRTRCAPLIWGH